MAKCKVYLDENGVFNAGSNVSGRVVCHFNKGMTIRGIKLRAYGEEHTEWMSSERYYNTTEKKYDTRFVTFTGDHQLYSLEIKLHGGSHEIEARPGQHTYPFEFRIPHNMPSSFQNSYGYICYTIKGIIDIPMAFDSEDEIQITVLSLIDLKFAPSSVFQPAEFSDEKTVCCFCCASGPINMDVKMPCTAFTPGQKVELSIYIMNMSNASVDELELEIVQVNKCHVDRPNFEEKHEKNILVHATQSGVGAHGENTYNISLEIPPDYPIANFKGSALFSSEYGLEISASLDGCHSDMDIYVPLHLGHISPQAPPYSPTCPTISGGYAGSAIGSGYPGMTGVVTQPPAPMTSPYPPANGAHSSYSPMVGYPQPQTSQPYPGQPYASDGKPVYSGGAPSAPMSSALPMSSAPSQKEILGFEVVDRGGAPSAPSELPPPTYEEARKNEEKSKH